MLVEELAKDLLFRVIGLFEMMSGMTRLDEWMPGWILILEEIRVS